jgi:hypothetical protein
LGDRAQRDWKRLLPRAVWVTVVFFVVVWGGYRFSVQPIKNFYANPTQAVQALHVPMPLKHVLHSIVEANPPVPAPALLKGMTAARSDTGNGRPFYLLQTRKHICIASNLSKGLAQAPGINSSRYIITYQGG